MARARIVLAIGCFLSLAGCETSSVDLNVDFAKTNLGFINSGAYKAGAFFRWDFDLGSLAYLGEIPGFPTAPPEGANGVRQKTSYEAGITLNAELSLVQKLALEAAIQSRSTFIVEDAKRLATSRVYTRISEAINGRANEGIAHEWGIPSAIEGNRTIYYLLVRDVTFGDQLQLAIDNEIKSGASFPVQVGNATVDVTLTGSGVEQIQGDDAVILFNVYVLEAYFEKSGGSITFAFRTVQGVNLNKLPQLLRKVGTVS